MPRIGVLALQGDFAEHLEVLRRLGETPLEVRKVEQLDGLEGLIIPGGESTTIVKLMDAYGLREGLTGAHARGLAIWGTCAGMIVVAGRLTDPYPRPLGLIDMTVSRNWFGRQIDSFETDLHFDGIGDDPFRAVFIRAPAVELCGPGVEVLAALDDEVTVAARSGRVLATAFHPELTDDTRVHEYFIQMAAADTRELEPPSAATGLTTGAGTGRK